MVMKPVLNRSCHIFQLTIYRCSNDRDQTSELDEVIMTALFKAQHLSPVEQLSLALAWNRCDIAKKEIFIYGKGLFINYKLSRGEICVANFIPPCEWCASG